MWIRLLLCSLLSLMFLSDDCLAEAEIFTIRNRPATEILPVVEALLSPQGKAVADHYGNMIVVNDTPDVIAEVRTLLLSADQRVPQVRIEVVFDSADSGQSIGFEQQKRKSGKHFSTEKTGYRYSNSNRKGRGRSFITVSSGSSGYIRMAREVPVTEKWIVICRRYGVLHLLQGSRTIETGMEVSPVAAGDQVIVTVTPRISWMKNGRTDSFRFVEATITVTVPRSQWFGLGGMSSLSESNKDILGVILSTGDSSVKNSFLMKIKADVNN